MSGDLSFMRIAERLARHPEHPCRTCVCPAYFGCVLVKKGRLLSVGWNSQRTSPRSKHPWRVIHAELDCLLGVSDRDTEGAVLLIARCGFAARATWMLAKPCPMCQELVHRARIKHVYFTVRDGVVGHWDVRKETWEEGAYLRKDSGLTSFPP